MKWLFTLWDGLVWLVLKLTGQCPEEDVSKTASDPNPTNEQLGRWIFHALPPLGDGEDEISVSVKDRDTNVRTTYAYERQPSGVWELVDVETVRGVLP